MKILSRYILKEMLIYFAIALTVFTSLVLTIRLLKFTQLIVNKGVEFEQVAMVFLSIIPTFLEIAVPLAALLGVMLAFARLSGDSELIVFRASGISLSQVIPPVLIFGILACLLSFYISLHLRPWGYRTLSKTLFEIARTKSTAGLSQGVFNKLGQLTIYADEISHDTGELKKVLIDDKRAEESRRVITAQSGKIRSNEEEDRITILLKDGYVHETSGGDEYVITQYATNRLLINPDDLYDPDIAKRRRRAREMNFFEVQDNMSELKSLRRLIDEAEEKPTLPEGYLGLSDPTDREDINSRIRGFRLEKGRRTSMPFAALVLAIVGMPLGIHSPRTQQTWGAGLSLALGIGVFMAYYGLLSIMIALAEGGSIGTYWALWIPNILAVAVSIFILRKVCREEWQSIADTILETMQKVFKRKKVKG